MDIPTNHDILLFRLMLCATVFFLAQHKQLHCSLIRLCVCQISVVILSNHSLFVTEQYFLRSLYCWLPFSLKLNFSSLSFYSLPPSDDLVFNHHYALNLIWLLDMCSRGTLLACRNYSKLLSLFFFIIQPQYFLSLRASVLVYPHRWALPLITMVYMCLETTFMLQKGYTRKYVTGIYSSIFSFGEFRNFLWAAIDGWFSTAIIVLSLSPKITSMIKQRFVECILWHIKNCISLHTFRSPLKVILALVFFHFFSPIIYRITISTGLCIWGHTNNALRYTTDDEYIITRGVVSHYRWSILPYHIICNGEFYLIYLFISSSDRAHNCTYDWLLCAIVTFILIWRGSSIAKFLTSRSTMPAGFSFFGFSQILANDYFACPKALWNLPPPL